MAHNILIVSMETVVQLYQDLCKAVRQGLIVEVSIRRKHSTKTLSQLGYLFGVVAKCIQEHFQKNGDMRSIDEIKEFLKTMFYCDTFIIKGEVIRVPKTLTKIDKYGMSKFIDDSVKWCMDNGIDVPPPPSLDDLKGEY